MALIQCLPGPTETNVGGETYSFVYDRERRAVAEVHNLVHVQCLLSVEHYIQVQPLPILPVLLGVSALPPVIEFSPEHQMPLGDIVREAFEASRADPDDTLENEAQWNKLEEWDRLVRIERIIDVYRAEADAEIAEAAKRAADAAAREAEGEAARLAGEAAAAAAAAEEEAARLAADEEAAKRPKPEKVVDKLTEIAGIGESTAAKLAEIDITSFAQIAAWDEATIRQLNEDLNLGNSITRNDWVGQAKTLQQAKDAAAATAAAAAGQQG